MTPEQIAFLDDIAVSGLIGPRPGSNAWPLVEHRIGAVVVPGEEIDDLIRRGLLVASPLVAADTRVLVPEPDDLADFEVDLTHDYRLARRTEDRP